MRRPDLADLVRYAAGTGLTVALTPGGTAAATPARLAALKDAGLSRVAVSLDGPDPETHERSVACAALTRGRCASSMPRSISGYRCRSTARSAG